MKYAKPSLTFEQQADLLLGRGLTAERDIAISYGLSAKVLESWLKTLNYVRNLCAHHSRLWNRTLGIKPMIPKAKHSPEWHTPEHIQNDKIYAVLSLLHSLLRQVAPQSNWRVRLDDLLTRYPDDVPLGYMGFPENWAAHSIWSASQGDIK